MSSNVTSPSKKKELNSSPSSSKGKAKLGSSTQNVVHEDDDDDDDDDNEEGMMSEEEEEEEEVQEDDFEEIDPSAIKSRRTRGVRVDYTSKEALEKAGLTGNEDDADDDGDEMKE